MDEFTQKKQQKERGLSVREALNNTAKMDKDIESMVIVYKKRNGDVETTFSLEQGLEGLGLLMIAQTVLTDLLCE